PQVDRIHIVLNLPTGPFRDRSRVLQIRTDAVYVAVKQGFGKDIRGKVAVAAFRAAEGNREVETEGHISIIPFSPMGSRPRQALPSPEISLSSAKENATRTLPPADMRDLAATILAVRTSDKGPACSLASSLQAWAS